MQDVSEKSMNTPVIRLAKSADVAQIHAAALATWEPTYRSIISAEQIQMMFDDLLSCDAIERQITSEQGTYVLALEDDVVVGFAYFSRDTSSALCYKLHRLYVRPLRQSTGIGSLLLRWVEGFLSKNGVDELVLNVNRFNTAQDFYRKNGYEIIATVDIPYKQFWLNDYVMKKALR